MGFLENISANKCSLVSYLLEYDLAKGYCLTVVSHLSLAVTGMFFISHIRFPQSLTSVFLFFTDVNHLIVIYCHTTFFCSCMCYLERIYTDLTAYTFLFLIIVLYFCLLVIQFDV